MDLLRYFECGILAHVLSWWSWKATQTMWKPWCWTETEHSASVAPVMEQFGCGVLASRGVSPPTVVIQRVFGRFRLMTVSLRWHPKKQFDCEIRMDNLFHCRLKAFVTSTCSLQSEQCSGGEQWQRRCCVPDGPACNRETHAGLPGDEPGVEDGDDPGPGRVVGCHQWEQHQALAFEQSAGERVGRRKWPLCSSCGGEQGRVGALGAGIDHPLHKIKSTTVVKPSAAGTWQCDQRRTINQILHNPQR